MTLNRVGGQATQEQQDAADYLAAVGDPLSLWVKSVGPIDAYDPHLPVEPTSPLEWFSFAVISRQLTRASASAIYHRLVADLGGAISTENVIKAGERSLHEAGLSHQKATTIWTLAAQMADGLLAPDELATMTDAQIEEKLLAIPGIGPSSAQRFLLHYLHRPDIFLAGDDAVRAAMTALNELETEITPKAAELRSEPWRPYRTYATSYLWGYAWETFRR